MLALPIHAGLELGSAPSVNFHRYIGDEAGSPRIFFGLVIAVESVSLAAMSDQARVLGKRVLLVEDDPAARESIKLLLTIDRHRVTEAKNGHEAMELFHQNVFDLVIIDYFMPQMHGKELASNLKLSAAVPILMVTAYAEKLVDMGIQVDCILAKPFGIAELRQAIAKLLER